MTARTPSHARAGSPRLHERWSSVLAMSLAATHRLRTSHDRLARVSRTALIVLAFTGVSVLLRGGVIAYAQYLNPDEVEMLAQGMAARHSPVPFTTWTTPTTGPVWSLFLALLAALGAPLTPAFAHLLSALLYGLIGAFAYIIARRSIGPYLALAVTAFVWLPLVLSLTGYHFDFSALVSELLPSVLILGAALIPAGALAGRPWLYVVSGVLAGLAVAAKYQALPVALGLFAVQALANDAPIKAVVRRFGLWALGAVLPAVVILVAMALSPDVSWTTVGQVANFLSWYGERITVGARIRTTFPIITSDHLVVASVLVAWLALRSTVRAGVVRVGVVLAGAAAVLAGGNGFGHYLIFMYAALMLAIGMPVKPGERVLPVNGARRRAAAVAALALVGWTLSFGLTLGDFQLTRPHTLVNAVSRDNVPRDPELAAVCPPGSDVVVWGWAPELYLYYSWRNAIPVFNTYLWTAPPANRDSGYEIVRSAIEDPDTDCVVEAVGAPFFAIPGETTPALRDFYPALASVLDRDYRSTTDVIDCEACVIYVRDP